MSPGIHDRISGGLNRDRLKLELRRSVVPLLTIGLGALLSLATWFVLLRNSSPSTYQSGQKVTILAREARGLLPGRTDVRVLGIKAGEVTDADAVGSHARITLKIIDKFLPVYRDARVMIRPQTALEDEYVDVVDRGHPAAGRLRPDDPLPASRVHNSVQVEDILQSLEPDVRARMAGVLRETATGLDGRGAALRNALAQLSPLLNEVDAVTQQLAERGASVKRLVHNTAVLTTQLGSRDAQLRKLTTSSAVTLETLETSSPQLDATLRGLPPLLAELQRSFATLRPALPDVDGALVRLRPVTRRLRASLAAVRELAGAATPALTALRTPVTRLTPLSMRLRPFAKDLDGAIRTLLPQAPAVDHVTKTTAGCSAAIQGFFQWTASTMKFGDAHGIPIRGDVTVGLDSTGNIHDPNVSPSPSCAPGRPIGGTPGTAGDLAKDTP